VAINVVRKGSLATTLEKHARQPSPGVLLSVFEIDLFFIIANAAIEQPHIRPMQSNFGRKVFLRYADLFAESANHVASGGANGAARISFLGSWHGGKMLHGEPSSNTANAIRPGLPGYATPLGSTSPVGLFCHRDAWCRCAQPEGLR